MFFIKLLFFFIHQVKIFAQVGISSPQHVFGIHVPSAEVVFLDQPRSRSQGFHMTPRNIQQDSVDVSAADDYIEFDVSRQGEDMNLKLIKDITFETRPVDFDTIGFGNFNTVNSQRTLDHGLFSLGLSPLCVCFEFDLIILLLQVEKDIHVILALMDFELIEGLRVAFPFLFGLHLAPELIDCLCLSH